VLAPAQINVSLAGLDDGDARAERRPTLSACRLHLRLGSTGLGPPALFSIAVNQLGDPLQSVYRGLVIL
jgi:hypothetical protein